MRCIERLHRVALGVRVASRWCLLLLEVVQILQPTNIARDHPLDHIIGDIQRGVQTRSRLASFCEHFSFVSHIEPKKIDEALRDVDWVLCMKSLTISREIKYGN